MNAPSAGPASVPGPPMIQAEIGIIEKSTAKSETPTNPEKCATNAPEKHPIRLPINRAYTYTFVTFIAEAKTA